MLAFLEYLRCLHVLLRVLLSWEFICRNTLQVSWYSAFLSALLRGFLAGFAGYLLVSWICLEPTWKRRVLNLIIAALIFRVYFLAPGAEAYFGNNSFCPA